MPVIDIVSGNSPLLVAFHSQVYLRGPSVQFPATRRIPLASLPPRPERSVPRYSSHSTRKSTSEARAFSSPLLVAFHSQVYLRGPSVQFPATRRIPLASLPPRPERSAIFVMLNIPKTLNEVRRDRASTKRKITNLLKEGDSLTQSADSGLPSTEFIKLAEQIRVQLDVLHANNEQYINLKCSVLVLGADATEEKKGVEEETIADTETNYLDEVRDRAVPMIHELIKISEHVLHRDSPPIPISTAPTAQMQKLKFPTFSGDIREYKRFRELFIHFTNHLNHIECLYQLVECMQRPAERNKIKPCTDYHRAWQILDEHYGDDDRLVDILLRDIENLNSYATKGRVNLAEMETFTESIQNFITQVEGINMTQDLNGRLLVTQIRRKLQEEHCLLFLQRVADGKSEDSVRSTV